MNLHKKKIIKMLVLVALFPGFTFLTGETPAAAGKIIGFNADDLVVRTTDKALLLFPFENGTFVGPRAGKRVGHNWHTFECINYLVGKWTGKRTPDMIVRDANGDLYLYHFEHETFTAGKKVGENFHYTHYFVGHWTGKGTDDLGPAIPVIDFND